MKPLLGGHSHSVQVSGTVSGVEATRLHFALDYCPFRSSIELGRNLQVVMPPPPDAFMSDSPYHD